VGSTLGLTRVRRGRFRVSDYDYDFCQSSFSLRPCGRRKFPPLKQGWGNPGRIRWRNLPTRHAISWSGVSLINQQGGATPKGVRFYLILFHGGSSKRMARMPRWRSGDMNGGCMVGADEDHSLCTSGLSGESDSAEAGVYDLQLRGERIQESCKGRIDQPNDALTSQMTH
jgi:hypothetical protein